MTHGGASLRSALRLLLVTLAAVGIFAMHALSDCDAGGVAAFEFAAHDTQLQAQQVHDTGAYEVPSVSGTGALDAGTTDSSTTAGGHSSAESHGGHLALAALCLALILLPLALLPLTRSCLVSRLLVTLRVQVIRWVRAVDARPPDLVVLGVCRC